MILLLVIMSLGLFALSYKLTSLINRKNKLLLSLVFAMIVWFVFVRICGWLYEKNILNEFRNLIKAIYLLNIWVYVIGAIALTILMFKGLIYLSEIGETDR